MEFLSAGFTYRSPPWPARLTSRGIAAHRWNSSWCQQPCRWQWGHTDHARILWSNCTKMIFNESCPPKWQERSRQMKELNMWDKILVEVSRFLVRKHRLNQQLQSHWVLSWQTPWGRRHSLLTTLHPCKGTRKRSLAADHFVWSCDYWFRALSGSCKAKKRVVGILPKSVVTHDVDRSSCLLLCVVVCLFSLFAIFFGTIGKAWSPRPFWQPGMMQM